MDKIELFIYHINLTKPGIKDGVFHADWDAGEVRARLEVKYQVKVTRRIPGKLIVNGDSKGLALEVAKDMEGEYNGRTSMPLLERRG